MSKITVEQLIKKYPAKRPQYFYWAIFNKNRIGLQRVVTGIGKKAVVDEQAFAYWLRTH